MTATDVRPPRVSELLPREIDVVPTVNELFVSEAFAMFVNVLVEPEIDLLVNVSVLVRATSVSVPVGIVTVPLLDMDAMTGSVRVLLVSV